MVLRFASGSVTPSSSRRKSVLGLDVHERDVVVVAEQRHDLARPRPARSRPWSTKTQVSWSAIASWISTAATAESTPPERPQMTRPPPTCARMRGDGLVAEGLHGPVAGRAGDAADEVAQERRAVRRVHDLGMELHRVEVARLVGDRGEGCVVGAADDLEARRQPRDAVAVAHPDRIALALAPHALEQRAARRRPRPRRGRTRGDGRPRPRRRAAPPSSARRSRCRAPARRRSKMSCGARGEAVARSPRPARRRG